MPTGITLPEGGLNKHDLDRATALMIIFFHAGERMMRLVEEHYEAEYRAGDDYRKLSKIYGKVQADAIVKKMTREIIRGDERMKLGRILKHIESIHTLMDGVTTTGITVHSDDTTAADSFDALMHDAKQACYISALMTNIREEDMLKAVSTLKILAKDKNVSHELLEMLEQ